MSNAQTMPSDMIDSALSGEYESDYESNSDFSFYSESEDEEEITLQPQQKDKKGDEGGEPAPKKVKLHTENESEC